MTGIELDLAVYAAAAFLAGIVSVLAGMGGGVLLFAVLVSLLPLADAVALHALIQVFANSSRLFVFKDSVTTSLFAPYAIGSLIGIVAIGLFWSISNSHWLSASVGIVLGLYAFFATRLRRLKQTPPTANNWAFVPVGALVGGLSMMIGSAGPILTPFLRARILGRHAFIATKALLQLWVQIVKSVVFATALSFPYSAHMAELICMCASLGIGTMIGKHLLGTVNEELFDLLVRALLLFAAMRLIWDAVAPIFTI